MVLRVIVTALTASFLASASAGQAPNLVVGGDFETVPQGSAGSACHSCLLPSVPGWSSNLGYRVDRFQNLPACIKATINPLNPTGGTTFLSLQGSVCCGCNNNGWIEQAIPTVVGSRYRLSFDTVLDILDSLQVKAGSEQWTFVGNTELTWSTHELEFVATNGTTLLRFASMSPSTSTPSPNGTCWEGEGCLLDNVNVREVDPCPGDITGGGVTDAIDLAAVLGAWGTSGQGKFDADVNDDGTVDAGDLSIVLAGWGPCPN